MNYSPRLRAEFRARTWNTNRTLVLSVDDDPTVLFTRQRILELHGYHVLSAANGEEALAVFDIYPIRIVLLDYAMPGRDGGMVALEMKKRKPHVPIVIVSAQSVPEHTVSCADGFVTKGEGPALLLAAIQELLPPAPLLRLK